MIEIVNLKYYRGKSYYIGRPSLLGNPFKIGKDGTRNEVIAKYRVYLWNEIKRKGKIYKEFIRIAELARKEDLVLSCWCKHPKREIACHGDVIAAAIEWHNKENKMALNDIDIFENEVSENVESILITGIDSLDAKLGHLQSGIVVLKGKSGSGKTAFALQVLSDVKHSGLFVTVEQSDSSLAKRLIARKGRIPLANVVNGTAPKEDVSACWNHCKETLFAFQIENSVNGAISLEYLVELVKQLKEKTGANRCLVSIDSWNDFISKSMNNYEGLTKLELAKKLTVNLNDLSKEHGFTVLLTLQAGKEKEIEEQITYAAEQVLSIVFDKEGREDSAGIKKSRITIEKNRTGSLGTVFLDFEGSFQNFRQG